MVSQYNTACQRTCSYLLDDPFKGEVLDSFDTNTGIAAFSSLNVNLDNMSLTISIKCVSDFSTIPEGETPPITVTFNLLDKCRLSTIDMPTIVPSSETKYLWEVTNSPFSLGSNSMGCGPISYELIGLP